MNLRDQLAALGVRRGTAGLPPAPPPAGVLRRIEDVVAGEVRSGSRGECFVALASHAGAQPHGPATLDAFLACQPASLGRLARNQAFESLDLRRLAFVDLETTGLGTGAGTYAFLVGIGRFRADDSFELVQFFMRDYAEEPAQMELVADYVADCEGFVSFNGRCFDLPLLQTRMAMAGLPPALPRAPHLDLLFPARRVWRGVLDSCGLSALEQGALALQRTVHDVPGYLIPGIYFDYLRSGNAGELAGVFYHNAQDILSMVALATRLAHAVERPAACGMRAEEMLGVARLHEDAGQIEQCVEIYRRIAAEGPSSVRATALERIAPILKRAGRRDEAAVIWQRLVDDGSDESLVAHVELAKYHEWVARDCACAEQVTQRAIAVAQGWRRGPQRRQTLEELEHRLARLQRKLAGQAPASDEAGEES